MLAGERLFRVLERVSKESIIELTPGKIYQIRRLPATVLKLTKQHARCLLMFTTSDMSLGNMCLYEADVGSGN